MILSFSDIKKRLFITQFYGKRKEKFWAVQLFPLWSWKPIHPIMQIDVQFQSASDYFTAFSWLNCSNKLFLLLIIFNNFLSDSFQLKLLNMSVFHAFWKFLNGKFHKILGEGFEKAKLLIYKWNRKWQHF